MHIPSSLTKDVALVSFEEAYAAAGKEREDYDVKRWLYVPPVYTEYRYILGTRGARPLVCVGINPSTACPDALDNTLKSVERIALASGFDSFLMFNVYAQRATDPDDMERQFNPYLHEQNLAAFDYTLRTLPAYPVVWAAWGTIIEKRPFLADCLDGFLAVAEKYGVKWVCAGRCSKAGHPHHPLYLRKDEPLVAFDAAAYRKKAFGE